MKKKKGGVRVRLFDWKTCSTDDSEDTMEELMIQRATKDALGEFSHIRFTEQGSGLTSLLVSLKCHEVHELIDIMEKVIQKKVFKNKPKHMLYTAAKGNIAFIKAGNDYGMIRTI